MYNLTVCCARYKTRPGLTYHMNHSHRGYEGLQQMTDEADKYGGYYSAPSPISRGATDTDTNSSNDALAGLKKFQQSFMLSSSFQLNTPAGTVACLNLP